MSMPKVMAIFRDVELPTSKIYKNQGHPGIYVAQEWDQKDFYFRVMKTFPPEKLLYVVEFIDLLYGFISLVNI